MKSYKITVNGKTYDVCVEENKEAKMAKAVAAPKAEAPAAAPKAAAPAPAPAAAPAPKAAPVSAGANDVTAPIAGKVLSVKAKVGDSVTEGQVLVVVEVMKMETEIMAPANGTVKAVNVAAGDAIEAGQLLVSLE